MRSDNPILIAVFGLPGTGKTTFAGQLSRYLRIKHLNTDIIRNPSDGSEHYDEENKALVYDKMLELAESEIETGKSVIVDGTFYKRQLRNGVKELAKRYAASVKWIEIHASAEAVKERISKKRPYSEADYDVYQKIKTEFEPMEDDYKQLFSERQEESVMIENAIEFIER